MRTLAGGAFPPDGWVITGEEAPEKCSWCDYEYVRWGCLVVCPNCDPIGKWAGHHGFAS